LLVGHDAFFESRVGIDVDADRDAFDHAFEVNQTGGFGDDRVVVRVFFDQDLALAHLDAVFGMKDAARRRERPLDFLAFAGEDDNFAAAVHDDGLVLAVDGRADVPVLDGAVVAMRMTVASTCLLAAPPMWNVRMVNWVPGSPID